MVAPDPTRSVRICAVLRRPTGRCPGPPIPPTPGCCPGLAGQSSSGPQDMVFPHSFVAGVDWGRLLPSREDATSVLFSTNLIRSGSGPLRTCGPGDNLVVAKRTCPRWREPLGR